MEVTEQIEQTLINSKCAFGHQMKIFTASSSHVLDQIEDAQLLQVSGSEVLLVLLQKEILKVATVIFCEDLFVQNNTAPFCLVFFH